MTEPGTTLLQDYRGIVCDLDGVVYRGHEPVRHAVATLNDVVKGGRRVVYATNNASRTPAQVAAQLTRMGLTPSAADVVTSAQAGARRVRELVGEQALVLAVGGEGVRVALREEGLVVATEAAGVRAVLQGFGQDVGWRDLAEAAYAVQAGAVWVATNVDATLPTDRGTAPGNGTLVEAVTSATGQDPVVVGKPWTPLYELSTQALGVATGQILAVGDRLDTDIAGANAAGIDALVVLTGVHGPADLAAAEPAQRPRYVATDLRCLTQGYEAPRRVDGGWACGPASVGLVHEADPVIRVVTEGPAELVLRASLAAWWEAVDAGRRARDQPGADGEHWAMLADRIRHDSCR